MGASAREMARALRESMDILRAENQVQAHVTKAGPSFLKREFFRTSLWYEVLETSKVERSSYPAKRTINSKLSEAETAFIQQKFATDHGCYNKIGEGTFGQVLECLDNENLEHQCRSSC
ncbi:unnamed protein product [Camellia sinensis]